MSSKKEFTIRPFEKLRKTIERQTAAVVPPARIKKKGEFTEEELFSSAMNDVQEIEAFRALSCFQYHPEETASSKRRHPDAEALTILEEITAGQRPINLADTQEYVEWSNPDYHDTITAKLHQGHFSVQASLDLHGCTVPEAEEEIDNFIRDAFMKSMTCVKIIHGRGLRSVKGPRLKESVIRKLVGRYRTDTIAFASARQCDGGLGALYVLLRKK